MPVKVKAVRNGIATGDAAKFGVLVRPASATPAVAEQHLFVAEAPPGEDPADGGTGASGGTPTTKAGATKLSVFRQGRTTRRVLRFRLVKRSRVSAQVQRRVVTTTKNENAKRTVKWKTMRKVRARTFKKGTRRLQLGRLKAGRYRVVLSIK